MLDFIFRKKPTILLLLAIIVISLIFSLLLNQPLQEGATSMDPTIMGPTINNPPPKIVSTCYDIIQDPKKTRLQKLSEIRPLVNNTYVVLTDIYSQNEKSILNELSLALDGPVQKNAEGKPLDGNALDGSARDTARKVLSSDNLSGMEKVLKIKEILITKKENESSGSDNASTEKDSDDEIPGKGTDTVITKILNVYIKSWFSTVRENIKKLYSTSNDKVVPAVSP
jgi:hypothetical protein